MSQPDPTDSPIPMITKVAGSVAHGGDRGDGGPATQALLDAPSGVALDEHRNVYIADYRNHRVRKISSVDGTITAFAGIGDGRFGGDGGPATEARLNEPTGVAVDGRGDVYIADRGNRRVRKVSAADGTITTIAGTGESGFSGDDGPATQARLHYIMGVAVDEHGNVYIADRINHRVRKVSAADGTITTIAGTGESGFNGDGGPATQAQLHTPTGVAVDARGNVYLADQSNNRVRKVTSDGAITTIAGTGKKSSDGDGGPATQADLYLPAGVTLDEHGNVYFTERGSTAARVRKVSAFDGKITTVAGTGWTGNGAGGRPALETSLNEPCDVAVDRRGSVYIVSGTMILEVPALVRLAGQLVATASSVSGDPVTHTRIRFFLDGNVSARFPGNATSTEVMTNEHGIATAPVLMVGANVGMFTVHVTDLDNPKSHPTTTHPETTSR